MLTDTEPSVFGARKPKRAQWSLLFPIGQIKLGKKCIWGQEAEMRLTDDNLVAHFSAREKQKRSEFV